MYSTTSIWYSSDIKEGKYKLGREALPNRREDTETGWKGEIKIMIFFENAEENQNSFISDWERRVELEEFHKLESKGIMVMMR